MGNKKVTNREVIRKIIKSGINSSATAKKIKVSRNSSQKWKVEHNLSNVLRNPQSDDEIKYYLEEVRVA